VSDWFDWIRMTWLVFDSPGWIALLQLNETHQMNINNIIKMIVVLCIDMMVYGDYPCVCSYCINMCALRSNQDKIQETGFDYNNFNLLICNKYLLNCNNQVSLTYYNQFPCKLTIQTVSCVVYSWFWCILCKFNSKCSLQQKY